MQHIFWTGGWDSTFGVLKSVIVDKEIVQPYYVIDEHRKSVKFEREAMNAVRRAVSTRFGADVEKRLLSTIEVRRSDVVIPEDVTAAYLSLRDEMGLGTQYEWLAAFANSQDVAHFDVALHARDFSESSLMGFLNQYIVEENGIWCVPKECPDPRVSLIFRSYSYSLLDVSKSDMKEVADKYDFLPMLSLSHFCHAPDDKGRACGVCKPCRVSILEGMAWRVPMRGRIKNLLVTASFLQFLNSTYKNGKKSLRSRS